MSAWVMALSLLSEPWACAALLGDDSFEVRQGAQRRLEGMGAWALPAVAAASQCRVPERRRRAEKLLRPWIASWERLTERKAVP